LQSDEIVSREFFAMRCEREWREGWQLSREDFRLDIFERVPKTRVEVRLARAENNVIPTNPDRPHEQGDCQFINQGDDRISLFHTPGVRPKRASSARARELMSSPETAISSRKCKTGASSERLAAGLDFSTGAAQAALRQHVFARSSRAVQLFVKAPFR